MALRMTSTCSLLISPWAWATAVAGSTGGSDGPVNAGRGANSAASFSRRLASLVEIRQRIESTSFQDLAPISLGRRLGLQAGQHAVTERGQLTPQGFEFIKGLDEIGPGQHP